MWLSYKDRPPVINEVAKSAAPIIGGVAKSAAPIIGEVAKSAVGSAVPVMGPVIMAMAKQAFK